MNKILSTIGIIFTLIYSFSLYYLIYDRLDCIHSMPLNEVGDFLAGIFGPLATFWLILGFFQQGIELRLNTSALKQQAIELEKSVQQQEQLVAVSKDQFDATLNALNYERDLQKTKQRPIFTCHNGGYSVSGNTLNISFYITNNGQPVTEVILTTNPKIPSIERRESIWKNEKKLHFQISKINDANFFSFELDISYLDSLENKCLDQFNVILKRENLEFNKI